MSDPASKEWHKRKGQAERQSYSVLSTWDYERPQEGAGNRWVLPIQVFIPTMWLAIFDSRLMENVLGRVSWVVEMVEIDSSADLGPIFYCLPGIIDIPMLKSISCYTKVIRFSCCEKAGVVLRRRPKSSIIKLLHLTFKLDQLNFLSRLLIKLVVRFDSLSFSTSLNWIPCVLVL